jgi:DTW domain-containing protein YfiP
MARALCERCRRPLLVCLCAAFVEVETRTRVVVLQHPREADNPIGTAWIAERCLSARRIVGVDLEEDPDFRAAISDPRAPAIVLSPGPAAIDLEHEPPDGPVTLIAVDGTWSQAKKLLRINPSLARLPRYAFRPRVPGRYRIRREPAAHCVSTIEAIVSALAFLDDPAPEVLAVFDAMIDRQIAIAAERAESRHLSAAQARPPKQRSPDLLEGDPVVVAVETNAWPRGSEHGPFPEIVQIAAQRASGARFECFVRPTRPLAPNLAVHGELDLARVLAGEDRARAVAAFRAFAGDRVATWGAYAQRALIDGGFASHVLDLRRATFERFGRRGGDVTTVAEAIGAGAEPAWASGRSGRRLAAATAIARASERSFRTRRAHVGTNEPGTSHIDG